MLVCGVWLWMPDPLIGRVPQPLRGRRISAGGQQLGSQLVRRVVHKVGEGKDRAAARRLADGRGV